MNKLIATVLVAALVSPLAGCWGDHAVENNGERVQQIGVEDSPKPIRRGVERDYPGATITRIERVREDGRVSYIVYLTTMNGDRREIRYSGDGDKMGKR